MDKFSVRAVIHATGISATIALLAVSISVQARALDLQQRQQFSIPSESLNVALTAFSAQTGIHVVMSGAPAGALSPGANGQLSTVNALTTLLRGTGMVFRQIDAETLLVVPGEMAKLRPTQYLLMSDATDHDALAVPAATPAAAAPGAGAPAPQGLQEVQITGTRITIAGYEAPTPLTAVSTQELQAAANPNLADTVNDLPQLSNSSTPTNGSMHVSGGASGENVLNLRNLGESRTLVLVDGQRWVTSDTTGEVDLNNIPQGLVSRVDLVTGGASAAYGSDAVAGVVNFILDTGFTGLKGEVSGGETTYGDDANSKVSLTWGTPFADNRGHFLFEGDLNTNAGVLYNDRAWAKLGWKDVTNPNYTPTNGQPYQEIEKNVGLSDATPGGIIVSGPLKGTYFGAGGTPLQFNYGNPAIASNTYVQGGSWQQSDPDQYATLDDRVYRQSLFGRASYDVSANLNVFLEYSYGFTKTIGEDTNEYSLGGLTVNVSNPFLPASVAAAAAADHLTTLAMGTLYGDLPAFGTTNYRTVNRYVLGANGAFDAFGTPWKWDTYLTYGNSFATSTAQVTYNSNLAAAENAVRAPNGSIVCADTLNPALTPQTPAPAAPNCVPFNVFGTGVNSQAAVNYVEGEGDLNQTYQQTAGGINVSGQPFSDWAGKVGLAFGVDGRKESASGIATANDLAQNEFAGNYLPLVGHYEVWEGYFEAAVPLAENLDLNAAARATDYSVSGYVTTWKAGLEYSPIPDVRLRATESSDIRAPNISDLYSRGAFAHSTLIDYANNNANYAAYQGSTGNVNLQPEKARTSTVGIVLQPRFMPGFNASVDFYYIDITDAIGSASSQQEILFCYEGITLYCSGITRGGPLGPAGIPEITQTNAQVYNQAAQTESGIDYDLSYRLGLEGLFPSLRGNLTFRLLASNYLYDIVYAGLPGIVPVNSAGTQGGGGSGPPTWQYHGSITYDNDPFAATLTLRGISSGVYGNNFIQCTTNCPPNSFSANYSSINDNHVAGEFITDFNFTYTLHTGNTSQAQFFFQVTNLFNRDPTIAAWGPTGGSNPLRPADNYLYDLIGRTIHAGVRFSL